ncbi:MAG: hypothetical protein KDE63_12320 [Novosphingobium sp.]|nr:hypothetical protein [Novosphingobium sp.]
MADKQKNKTEQINDLIAEYRNARDEQRAATESAMGGNSEAGDRMQEIADKLEKLGVDPAEFEGEGANTL